MRSRLSLHACSLTSFGNLLSLITGEEGTGSLRSLVWISWFFWCSFSCRKVSLDDQHRGQQPWMPLWVLPFRGRSLMVCSFLTKCHLQIWDGYCKKDERVKVTSSSQVVQSAQVTDKRCHTQIAFRTKNVQSIPDIYSCSSYVLWSHTNTELANTEPFLLGEIES